MNTLFRILNTLLLAGIFATQVLILLHIRQPIQVREPISVEPTFMTEQVEEIKAMPVKIVR
jgi:hypothetical protein